MYLKIISQTDLYPIKRMFIMDNRYKFHRYDTMKVASEASS